MTPPSQAEVDRLFIDQCVALELLSPTNATTLREQIGQAEGSVVYSAVRRGLLTAADVDIVQSLQYPTDIVPGYRILELIGRGAMGVVYRAEQLDLEKIVALKTILISNVHDPTIAARFEREAKSVARLQHPNIVQALNFGKHEGRYYFAMEYVPGRTCEQAVGNGRLMQPDAAWSIIRQVASGLMHALDQNVIHRDIKPANLILLTARKGSPSDTEVVKIADFGLAIFADEGSEQLKLTTGDKIMGSPAYMSLEQFGGRSVDFRSDLYSLGATAWHLLFGKPPFKGGSVAALFVKKSEPFVVDPTVLPTRLPDDQMRLLIQLLDPNPDERPQSYEQLIDAIDALAFSGGGAPNSPNTSIPNVAATGHGLTGERRIVGDDDLSSGTDKISISDQPTLDIPASLHQNTSGVTPGGIPPKTVAGTGRSTGTGGENSAAVSAGTDAVANGLATGLGNVPADVLGNGTGNGTDNGPSDSLSRAMPATMEISRDDFQSTSERSKRRGFIVAIMSLIGILAAASILWFVNFSRPERGPRTHTRVVGNTPLFDGVTLSGWDVGGSMVGAWNTVEAPDSSTALACTTRQGAITRRYSETPFTRISLFVWLQPGGGAVDIDFALDPVDPADMRGCLRLTASTNQLGVKRLDFDDLDVTSQSDALSTVHERYHVIHIERQQTDWYVFLEEQLIGTIPIERIGRGNAIRLVVHGNTDEVNADQSEPTHAFFADVQLYELSETVKRDAAL